MIFVTSLFIISLWFIMFEFVFCKDISSHYQYKHVCFIMTPLFVTECVYAVSWHYSSLPAHMYMLYHIITSLCHYDFYYTFYHDTNSHCHDLLNITVWFYIITSLVTTRSENELCFNIAPLVITTILVQLQVYVFYHGTIWVY